MRTRPFPAASLAAALAVTALAVTVVAGGATARDVTAGGATARGSTAEPATARGSTADIAPTRKSAADASITAFPAQLPTEGYRLVDTWTSREAVNSVPRFKKPGGVDVAADETVYAVDSQLNQVYHLDAGGQVLQRWDTDPAVGSPLDVAASVDRVYVVGTEGGEVRNRTGALQRTFQGSGFKGVAVGPDRRVYLSRVTQAGGTPTGVVELRDVDGNVLGAPWKSDIFPMRATFGLDVGLDGRVYIAADGGVYVFDAGTLTALMRVRQAIEGPDLVDVAVDDRGRVYAVMFGQTGMLVAWKGVVGTQGDYLGDVVFGGARWLAVGPGAGLVVAVEGVSFAGLSYLSTRDDLTTQPLRWGEVGDSLGQLDAPRRVAVGAAGDVYLVDRTERVQRWSVLGNPQEQWDTPQLADVAGGAARPCYIRGTALACLGPSRTVAWEVPGPQNGWLTAASGNSSRLAVVDLANQRLALYDRSNGQAAGGWALSDDGSFTAVSDVAMDETAVYLANRTSRRVEVYSLTGELLRSVDVPGVALRVAVADGALYALTRDGWIYKYDANSVLKSAFDAAPGGSPADLAAGPSGRVYVADYHPDADGETVQEVSQVLVYEPGGSPPGQLPPQPERTCVVGVDKRAAPAQVYLGEEVSIQLKVQGSCPPGEGQVDVALIVDQSGSMTGAAISASQAAAIGFLAELDPKGAQVALVAFSTTATVLQPLTSDLRQVVRSVAKITAGGTTNYTDALNKALGELTGPNSRPASPRIMVMMTDGNPTDRTDVEDTADRVKAAGIILYTVGLGKDLDRDLLRGMASSPDLFYEAPSETQLSEIYTTIAQRIGATRLLRTGLVVDELPADMELVPGSMYPLATVVGHSLTWDLANVPITGQSLTYRVKPQQPGRRPTNVQASLDYVDSTGQDGQLTFPVPAVDVLKRTRFTALLPYLTKNRCRPQRADVVLVFDTSNSMLEPARAGSPETKLQAAQAAGRAFLDFMVLPGDQAAIVNFHGTVTTPQRLTGSRVAILSALAGLQAGAGTRIDLGLNAAAAELLSSRHQPSNTPVIVLLTDGKPSGTTEAEVIRAGQGARALGFQLFAIGLGDADMDLLRFVAGSRDHIFYAPQADALLDIYAEIAGRALCD